MIPQKSKSKSNPRSRLSLVCLCIAVVTGFIAGSIYTFKETVLSLSPPMAFLVFVMGAVSVLVLFMDGFFIGGVRADTVEPEFDSNPCIPKFEPTEAPEFFSVNADFTGVIWPAKQPGLYCATILEIPNFRTIELPKSRNMLLDASTRLRSQLDAYHAICRTGVVFYPGTSIDMEGAFKFAIGADLDVTAAILALARYQGRTQFSQEALRSLALKVANHKVDD